MNDTGRCTYVNMGVECRLPADHPDDHLPEPDAVFHIVESQVCPWFGCNLTFQHKGEHQTTECGWFAGCHRDATHYRPHPILGDVTICDSCDEIVYGHGS